MYSGSRQSHSFTGWGWTPPLVHETTMPKPFIPDVPKPPPAYQLKVSGGMAFCAFQATLLHSDYKFRHRSYTEAKKAWNGQKMGSEGDDMGLGIIPPAALWTAA